VDFGVDWFTTTAVDAPHARKLASVSACIARQQVALGNIVKPWSMYGYDGHKVGGLQFGERHDGVIVRLSSATAAEHWASAYRITRRCSRIDTQVTVRNGDAPQKTLRRVYKQATKFSRASRRGPTVTLLSSNNESSTVYLGKRISDSFGRAYDKGVESGLPVYQGAVRFEVECKGAFAEKVSQVLFGSRDRPASIVDCCQSFFAKRGVVLELNYLKLHNYSCHQMPSDADKKLTWLAESVRGTIELLRACGRMDQVMTALNISIADVPRRIAPTSAAKLLRRA